MGENARDGSPSEQAAPPLIIHASPCLWGLSALLKRPDYIYRLNVDDERVAHV